LHMLSRYLLDAGFQAGPPGFSLRRKLLPTPSATTDPAAGRSMELQ
jgi:hypothetical protein